MARGPNPGGGTAVATAPARREFQAMLEASAPKIAETLPNEMSPERFVRIAAVAYAREPKLSQCDPTTVLIAVMQAAELGLEIGKPMDLCHLVPYGRECQLVIDYKGWLDLAYRTGGYATIDARLIRERDEFDLHYDPLPRFRHRPFLGADPGPITHAYAFALPKDGEVAFEVMTIDEVEAIRKGSRSANSPAWQNHYGEMCKKVPLKRFLKRRPRSVQIARAAEIDDAGHDFEVAVSRGPGHRRRALGNAGVLAALDGPAEPEFTEGTPGVIGSESDEIVDDPEGLPGEPGMRG